MKKKEEEDEEKEREKKTVNGREKENPTFHTSVTRERGEGVIRRTD